MDARRNQLWEKAREHVLEAIDDYSAWTMDDEGMTSEEYFEAVDMAALIMNDLRKAVY